MTGRNLALTDYLGRLPMEEATTEETREQYLIKILCEFFKPNHK